MATLHGNWDCEAAAEQIDTYNEIHKKLVDLNLQSMFIDQQLKKLIQECSERDDNEVSFLKREVEVMNEDQESTKHGLRELLMAFFQPKCFHIGNLESFVLEQEIYNLMISTKRDDIELKILMAKIEGLTRSVDERNKKVNDLKMELDRIPKMSNFSTSGRSLSDVVVEMIHRFARDVALDIQESVASRRLVNEPFENDSMFEDFDLKGEGFDPMDYLDHQFFS